MPIASEEHHIELVLDAERTVDLFIPLGGERFFLLHSFEKIDIQYLKNVCTSCSLHKSFPLYFQN